MGDKANNLTRFFGILKKFNHNKDLDSDFRHKVEAYFIHRWNNDKNDVFS
jgi:hypothetical protein